MVAVQGLTIRTDLLPGESKKYAGTSVKGTKVTRPLISRENINIGNENQILCWDKSFFSGPSKVLRVLFQRQARKILTVKACCLLV